MELFVLDSVLKIWMKTGRLYFKALRLNIAVHCRRRSPPVDRIPLILPHPFSSLPHPCAWTALRLQLEPHPCSYQLRVRLPSSYSLEEKHRTMSSSERFDCHYCKDSLLGKKYIMKEDTQYCTKCYENLFANCCEGCSSAIGCNCKDLSYKDRHWHEQCFKCAKCSRSLVEKAFAAKDDLLLCTECYANDYSSKCTTCKKTIMPGSRKMEYKGNSWHETCFLCHRCQQPIGTKSFIPKDSGYFCVPCFEKQFAYQCCACKKAITTGGVTYQDKPWHRECFLCIGCRKQLSGQRFTSRENYPYCLDCFSNLYAKKCVGCTKPITSLAGAKYVSYEERQWHSECFTCMQCSVSLVGRGFLTQRDNVLCTDCGREK